MAVSLVRGGVRGVVVMMELVAANCFWKHFDRFHAEFAIVEFVMS